MPYNLDTTICIIENQTWLACKLKDFTSKDYMENIVVSISYKTYEILTSQKTSLETIDELLNWIKNWFIN